MLSGILLTVAACFCWGLVFIIPSFMEGFHAVEIALGRYFVYGSLSFLLLLLTKRTLFAHSNAPYWKAASYLSFLSTVLGYSGTVLNLQYAGPMIGTLVFAMSPICITLVGNWHKKECPTKKLLMPLAFMIAGIVLAEWKGPDEIQRSFEDYLLGLGGGIVGLSSWTLFAVLNSNFLKKNLALPVDNWALMLGTCTFLHVLIVGSCFYFIGCSSSSFFNFSSATQTFLMGSLALGTISTWLAFFLWNHGAKKIPISLAGQLMIFEIIFALILLYCIEKKLPSVTEGLGILLMLSGVWMGFAATKAAKKSSEGTTVH